MTIVLPQDYHARQALEQNRVHCMTKEQALKEDIRALRIGILNIMPKAETYEFSLLHPLGRSVLQIDPIWIRLLAYSKEAGYTIFESADHRMLAHIGHPEYEPQRLVDEYERDLKKGMTNVELPVNFDLENPVNLWRGHRTEFFSQWIKLIHEETTY